MSLENMTPLPTHYTPQQVGEVYRVAYENRAVEARSWAKTHAIPPAVADDFRVNLFLVDVQNTFCIPGFELFVTGRSGNAAVADNRRLCEFIYHHLGRITNITLTLDTHKAIQIFHAIYLVDAEGNHPAPYTLISVEDVESGRWRFNEKAAGELGITPEVGQTNLVHYVKELAKTNRYALTIWPYHAMLGGIGHAVVPAVEEAVFFHSVARYAQADFEVKGTNPFTEHYSVVGPEVTVDAYGNQMGERNQKFIQNLQKYDVTLIAGQAKSHCVASTISHLLEDILTVDPALAEKVYLLQDCTSPVVVPGMDYTEQADAEFARFAEAGMKIIQSTDAPDVWYRG